MQYDPDFVDAYYGLDSLRPKEAKLTVFPKDNLLSSVNALLKEFEYILASGSDTGMVRAKWISQQLIAFGRRIIIFSGEYRSFDEESMELVGVKALTYPTEHYQFLPDSLNNLLPGKGSVQGRFQTLANLFIILKNKLDTVFKTATQVITCITCCWKRTCIVIRAKLNYARNEETAIKSISFIKKYRSYVINYNYGQDLVKQYIESNGGTAASADKRWELFGRLLSNQVVPGRSFKEMNLPLSISCLAGKLQTIVHVTKRIIKSITHYLKHNFIPSIKIPL